MSRKFPIIAGSTITLLTLLTLHTFAQSALHPLEGSYKVTVTPDDMNGPDREYQDVFSFSPGELFVSQKMKDKGFGSGHYDEDSRRFGPSKFTAEIKSDKDGKMNYQGSADGTQITGTITWIKANGDKITFSYKGEPNR